MLLNSKFLKKKSNQVSGEKHNLFIVFNLSTFIISTLKGCSEDTASYSVPEASSSHVRTGEEPLKCKQVNCAIAILKTA